MNFTDIKMSYKFIGLTIPKGWTHNANTYKVTLKYNGKQLTIDYHMGVALDESSLTIENVLNNLLSDAQCTSYNFSEFCNEFGYDDDSIKALKIYKACKSISKKLSKLFDDKEYYTLKNYIDSLEL